MSRWINEPYNDVLTNKYISQSNRSKNQSTKDIWFDHKSSFYPENSSSLDDIIKSNEKFVIKPVTGGGGGC